MREPLEMVTASLMEYIVQIRKKNIYFVTKLFFQSFGKSSFGAFGVESPHGGAILSARPSLVAVLVVVRPLSVRPSKVKEGGRFIHDCHFLPQEEYIWGKDGFPWCKLASL